MPQGLLVVVGHSKGGVGKTCMTTNLAAAAHLAGLSTQILDVDPQGSTFAWSLLTAETSTLAGITTLRADKPMRSLKYREIAARFDVTIVDGPPSLTESVGSAATAADIILIPTQPCAADLLALDGFLAILDEAAVLREERGWAPSRRCFVVNRAIASTTLHRGAYGALEEHGEVVGTVHNRIAYQDAFGRGESVLTTEPHGPAAREIRQLARVLGITGAAHLEEAAQ
jgi:chromosome partitioning protein